MRDRLIELINQAEKKFYDTDNSLSNVEKYVADYLLENGVIVPPCNVGDTVYINVFTKKGYSHTITEKAVGMHILDSPKARGNKPRKNYIIIHCKNTNSLKHIDFDEIGKTVFFSEEDAVKVRGSK